MMERNLHNADPRLAGILLSRLFFFSFPVKSESIIITGNNFHEK